MKANKISIRPTIKGLENNNKSETEKFQNQTIRPIIKLQHNLLIAFYENYLSQRKIDFKISTLKKTEITTKAFKTDNSLKTEIRGLIIGLFTTEEYIQYSKISSEINKRIITIITERIISTF